MESRYIAAIEIGSSKIKGIVAGVESTGAINILAVEETDSGDSVRHGRVQNAREVSTRVNDIIRRLENNPRLGGGHITSMFVSLGGRSLSSKGASGDITLAGEVEITPQIVEKLHKEARYSLATDRDVVAISDLRYAVDGADVKKIVGTFGKSIHGDFTMVTLSPENRRNLDRVKLEVRDAELPRQYVPRPVALAEMLLSDSERQLGSLLIDMGAQTTTMAVYRNNAVQLMATLPMGSDNITRDLSTGLGITAEAAENLKLTRGEAVADQLKVAGDPDKVEIINYVRARAGEIIANIINYLEHAGIKLTNEQLPGGIVLTGGGSMLKGFPDMIQTRMKLKTRQAVLDATVTGDPYNRTSNADVIALVRYAARRYDTDCVDMPEQPVADTAAATPPNTPAQTAAASTGFRRRVLDEDDPNILLDDELIDQPDNINFDNLNPDDPLVAIEGGDPVKVRKGLIARFRDWLHEPKDDVLDDGEGLDDDIR